MCSSVRRAEPRDLAAIVALSREKRESYAEASPTFWRKAESADELQLRFFERVLLDEDSVVYVSVDPAGIVTGFIHGQAVTAPPVYAPGGRICLVDDFCVASAEQWATCGGRLLDALEAYAKEVGLVLANVVCGAHDIAKREFLEGRSFAATSVWYVREVGGKDECYG